MQLRSASAKPSGSVGRAWPSNPQLSRWSATIAVHNRGHEAQTGMIAPSTLHTSDSTLGHSLAIAQRNLPRLPGTIVRGWILEPLALGEKICANVIKRRQEAKSRGEQPASQ